MPMLEHDVDLYYTELGKGQTVVFCHGAGGNSASWFNQFGAFMNDYHCVAYDCRGFGRSICSAQDFDCSKFGSDAIALLDHLEVESAYFVCQSMGGWTGVRAALDYPDRVRKLVLSDTIGGIALAAGIESIQTLGDRVSDTRLAHAALAAVYPERNPAGAFLYGQISEFNQLPQSVVVDALFSEANLISIEAAQTLTLPILIFSGIDDVLWPPAVLKELCELLPSAERCEIDSGHSPYFENPAVFNEVLAEFLQREVASG